MSSTVQAVCRVYENGLAATDNGAGTIHIVCHLDTSSGKNILLWDDIKAVFGNALYVRSGDLAIPFLKGLDFKNLDPLRIAAIPGLTLNVVVTGPAMVASPPLSALQAPPSPPSPPSRGLTHKNVKEWAKATAENEYLTALDRHHKAVVQGGFAAQRNLGGLYFAAQDYTQALTWYQKAAEQGHAAAQHKIGYLYQQGLGVSQDYAEAMTWFRKAAEQGHAAAQNAIGYLYYEGLGVSQDYAEAMIWFRKAAEQGHAAAHDNIGYLYHKGLGVSQDCAEAMTWSRKAVEQRNAAV
ncbi:hypothetical protein BGX24_000483 [Mortierella sp. AD032]|nr:hypothetical protein BGX24_000483 [Mortierella sp. AD032]